MIMKTRRLWIGFLTVVTVSFAVLLFFGREIYRRHLRFLTGWSQLTENLLFTGQDIKDGQNVWQSMGGQEMGTVWGHGAYQAPDWSADWLHREAVFILNRMVMRLTALALISSAKREKHL
jgi:nitric oxide reductase subunit B